MRFMHRTRYDIIAEILSVCRRGALQAHIIGYCQVSYDQVKQYLKYLVGNGLLRCEDVT